MSRFGPPADAGSLVTLVAGVALLVHAIGSREAPWSRWPLRWFLGLAATLSFALSAGYVAYYLRGAPRIIDATTYYLQARTYASGALGFMPPEPEASHFGRFLLAMPDGRLSALFPPGYPALLALGFRLQAEMWVGPLLGAALTIATYWVTRSCFDERAARLAAAMSVCCAALRYHTADTMAHGFCALLVLICVGSALHENKAWSPLGGLLLGWLLATRPVTGVVVLVVMVVVIVTRRTERPLRLLWLAASLPGLVALLWQQSRVTGSWFESSQYRYYTLADAPQGCFRYGLGQSIGCRAEHGAFVEAYLPDGYGFFQAAWTTGRRLLQHLSDAGNQELFAPVLLAALIIGFGNHRVRVLGFTLLLQVVAYAGFYFDGNYPGGGARMFADVLPLEHALIAWVLLRLGWQRFALPAMLLGFALHTSFDHRRLRDRDGGRPMWDEAGVGKGRGGRDMVFVGTDHGYNLGFDPAGKGPRVVRHKGDALDFSSWLAAGKPKAQRLLFDFTQQDARPELVPYEPAPSFRFELENQWPPRNSWRVQVERAPFAECTGTGLQFTPRAPGGWVEVSLWTASTGPHQAVLHASGPVSVRDLDGDIDVQGLDTDGACSPRGAVLQVHRAGHLRLRLTSAEPVWLDAIELVPAAQQDL